MSNHRKTEFAQACVVQWRRFAELCERRPLVLFFIPFVIYMSNFRDIGSGDTTGAKFVAIFLAESGTIYLDDMQRYFPYNEIPYFLSERHGHIVSNYPLFPGIMAVPFYAPFVWIGLIQPGEGNLVWDYVSKICASTYISLSIILTFFTLKHFISKSGALFLALAYGLGTALWPIASQSLWQHTGTVFWWSVCFYSTLRAMKSESNQGYWLLLAGTAAGCTILCRIIHLVSAGLYGLLILWTFRRKALLFAAPCALLTGILVTYNYWMFDTWNGGLAYVLDQRWTLDKVKGGVWSTPLFEGLAGVLISPSRGVFVFSPILLFALWGMIRIWRYETPEWRFFAYTLPVPAALFCLFAKYIVWWGGIMHYGPRYQVDAYPFLVIFLAAAWPDIRSRRWLLIAFIMLLVYSVFVQWVGAFCFPGTWAVKPVSLSDDTARLWQWDYNQIWDSFMSGIKSPY